MESSEPTQATTEPPDLPTCLTQPEIAFASALEIFSKPRLRVVTQPCWSWDC